MSGTRIPAPMNGRFGKMICTLSLRDCLNLSLPFDWMSMNTNHANPAVTETAIASPAQNGPQLSLSLLKGEGRGEGSPLSRRNFFRLTVPVVALFFAKHKSLAATESKTRHRFLCCDYQGNQ